VLGGLVAMAVPVVSACSASSGAPTAATVKVPLASTVEATDGPWATTPMGTLSDPLNTFWQIVHRPASGLTGWTDSVDATATATNGGLVVASSGARVLLGVLPTQDLKFTPVLSTTDSGRTWDDGVVPGILAALPSSLAAGDGELLALVTTGGSSAVLGASDLTHWGPVVSEADLAATGSGHDCSVASLDAVALVGSTPVVGATCSHPGVVGLFEKVAGAWTSPVVRLPASLSGWTTRVLDLRRDASGGLAALLAVAGHGSYGVVAAWSPDGSTGWTFSAELPLVSASSMTSLGAAGDRGFYVMQQVAAAATRLGVMDGPGAKWATGPGPADGTGPAAVDGAGVEVLSTGGTDLSVWGGAGSGVPSSWPVAQKLTVEIPFGSSN
jgi:hypothetical protein